MVKIDADPTSGPELDSSDPVGTAKSVLYTLVGIGFFIATFSAAQNTTAPLFKQLMNAVPGVDTGDEGTGIRVG